MPPRGKVVRSTAEQINRLVDYMVSHRLFACNQYSGPHGSERTEAEWARLKTMLSAYGPNKTIDQWKHTWRDLRKKAREEAIRARHAHSTDEGVRPELTDNNKKILITIGEKRANGKDQENGSMSSSNQNKVTWRVGAGRRVEIDVDTSPSPPAEEADAEHEFEYVPVEAEVEILESSPSPAPEPEPEPEPRPAPAPAPAVQPALGLRRRRALARRAALHSAALVRAQIRTNNILQDIAVELRTAARHRKRERIKGGVHSLKF